MNSCPVNFPSACTVIVNKFCSLVFCLINCFITAYVVGSSFIDPQSEDESTNVVMEPQEEGEIFLLKHYVKRWCCTSQEHFY